jgi:hypothetical protein
MTPEPLRSTQRAGALLQGAALAVVLAAVVIVLATAVPGRAQQVDASAVSGKLVTATARPLPGNSDLIYTAPPRATFLLTQACVEHPGVSIRTEGGDRITYGGVGCIDFKPALLIPSGERLRCDNSSGLARTCNVTGVLGPPAERHTAKIIDVEG